MNLEALLEAGKLLTSTLNVQEVLERSISIIEQMTGFKHYVIYLKEKKVKQLIPCKWKGYTEEIEKNKLSIEKREIITWVTREGKSLMVSGIDKNAQKGKNSRGFKSDLAVPIVFQKQVIGVINAKSKSLNFFTLEHQRLLEALASQIGIAVNNAQLYEEKSKLAMFDSLTNLYNRNYFNELLKIELGRSKRYGTDLSLLLIDVNNLKYINDHLGHGEGDRILKELARILKNNVREIDTVARYGGDEMAIILPAANREQAEGLIKRIRRRIDEWNQQNGIPEFSISVSIGQATTNRKVDGLELIAQADKEMYEDKRRYHTSKKT